MDWKRKPPTAKQHSSKKMIVVSALTIKPWIILYSLFVAHPTAAPTHKIITPSATTLSPSLHQLKSVRSGQPTRHGPRTFTIFSRIKPPTRRRKRLPGLIRNQVNIQSTHTPPKLLHLPHNFLDTEMPLRHIRKHRISRQERIIATRV